MDDIEANYSLQFIPSCDNGTEFRLTEASIIGLPVLLGLIFVIGLFGDALVLYIVQKNKHINILFFHIALAHLLLLLVCIPVLCVRYITSYEVAITDPLCKLVHFLTYVAVGVSVNCLVGICLLKYIAITHPVDCMITSRHAVILAFFIWATIGSANAPLLWYYKEADGDVCRLNPEHDYQYLIFIGLTFGLDFALPVLTICCITLGIAIQVHRQEVHEGSTALRRTNKRFIRLVLSILLVFVLTWGPFHLAYLLAMFRVYDNACPKNAAVFNFAVVLGLSNTCLNPVVYHLASLEFRQAFWNTLRAMRTMGQAPTDHEAGLELRPLSGIFRQNDANVTSYSCRSPTSTTCPV